MCVCQIGKCFFRSVCKRSKEAGVRERTGSKGRPVKAATACVASWIRRLLLKEEIAGSGPASNIPRTLDLLRDLDTALPTPWNLSIPNR